MKIKVHSTINFLLFGAAAVRAPVCVCECVCSIHTTKKQKMHVSEFPLTWSVPFVCDPMDAAWDPHAVAVGSQIRETTRLPRTLVEAILLPFLHSKPWRAQQRAAWALLVHLLEPSRQSQVFVNIEHAVSMAYKHVGLVRFGLNFPLFEVDVVEIFVGFVDEGRTQMQCWLGNRTAPQNLRRANVPHEVSDQPTEDELFSPLVVHDQIQSLSGSRLLMEGVDDPNSPILWLAVLPPSHVSRILCDVQCNPSSCPTHWPHGDADAPTLAQQRW